MTTFSEFEQCAVMVEMSGLEMLARLQLMTVQPEKIIYLGAVVTTVKQALEMQYLDAEIFFHDGEGELPFAHHSVDLIFANLFLPYVAEQNAFIKEAHRILKKEGLLMLSAFGVDTLKELRAIKPDLATPRIIDLHDLGDELLHNHFADPVMEVDHWVLEYEVQEKLQRELLVTSMCLSDELDALNLPQDLHHVTYEIIFGHAFASGEQKTFSADSKGVVKIPLAGLRKQAQ